MSGEMWFNALSGAGQSIAGAIDRQGAKVQQEQDILKEATGRAKSLGQTLKGLEDMQIIPTGTYDSMVKAQENMAPKAFIAFADQQGKQIGQLIQGGVEMQRFKNEHADRQLRIQEQMQAQQEKLQAAQADQQDQAKLAKAIQMATDTTGAVQPGDVVQGYLQMGGTNQKRLGEALNALKDAKPADAAWEPTGKAVTTPSGQVVEGVMTGKNDFRPMPKETPEDTAAMRNLAMRMTQVGNIQDAVAAGDINKGHRIAVALNLPGQYGGVISRDEMIDRFGAAKSKPPPPAGPATGATPAPAAQNERVIGGRTYVKSPSGWTLKQ